MAGLSTWSIADRLIVAGANSARLIPKMAPPIENCPGFQGCPTSAHALQGRRMNAGGLGFGRQAGESQLEGRLSPR